MFRSANVRVTPVDSTIDVCGAAVPLLPTIRDIGIILDNVLDMSAQVLNACRGSYFHLFRIAKIRKCLNTTACKMLVHSFVTSHIDYVNAVLYGISDRLLHRLEMVQRSSARVVLRIRRGDWQSMTAALKHLHWLSVKWRVEYKLLVLVFRALHDRTPAYLAVCEPWIVQHLCSGRPNHRDCSITYSGSTGGGGGAEGSCWNTVGAFC